jgi:hypothetical protein
MALVLIALACNRTVPTATPLAQTPGPSVLSTDVSPPGITPSATQITTSPVFATSTAVTPVCVYDAEFVTDTTIPDNTELEPGTAFVKTWRIRNDGTCAWEPGTSWVFDFGDKMDGPDSVGVPTIGAGESVDVTVDLIAPATPGEYTGYWRMRRPGGEVFGTLGFVRIVVAEDEFTPTPSAMPTATGSSSTGPVILFFRSDVEEADPGDTITLEWETEGGINAVLHHLMPTGQLGQFWEVDVSGSFDYVIDAGERNHTRFMLFVSDEEQRAARATHTVTLRCLDVWFFEPPPDECPASPATTSDGAEQHFERGTMIWIKDQDRIYILFDDDYSPSWRVNADEWDEGEPVDDPTLTPPSGRYQPVRGFGLIWREEPGVRDRLGWAVDLEVAYSTAVQGTSRPKYNDLFIRALDGKVWRLLPESSGWEKVP